MALRAGDNEEEVPLDNVSYEMPSSNDDADDLLMNDNSSSDGRSSKDKFAKKKKREYSRKYSDKQGDEDSAGRGKKDRFGGGDGAKKKKAKNAQSTPAPPAVRVVVSLPESLTVRELSLRSGIPTRRIITKLVEVGGLDSNSSQMDSEAEKESGVRVRTNVSSYLLRQLKFEQKSGRRRKSRIANQEVSAVAEALTINTEVAELLMMEFGIETKHEKNRVKDEFRTDLETLSADAVAKFPTRSPIVTVMGHVDHGKTSLLDALRSTDVAGGEAGGITQSVGAFKFALDEQSIVFLDTPGHEAFTSMRRCGTLLTDVVVLVIAATDGVRPQTVESIEMARAANVPIIVAVSKVDMPGIDADDAMYRISSELTGHDVLTDLHGGAVQIIPIAAPSRRGLDDLSEAILLQSAEMNLVADPKSRGEAVVLESRLDQGMGGVADIVTRWGTLKVGDNVVCGEQHARVRQLLDTVTGKPLKEAGPATPVRLVGFKEPPAPASDILAVSSTKRAREVADLRARRRRDIEAEAAERLRFEAEQRAAARQASETGEKAKGKKGKPADEEEDEDERPMPLPDVVPIVLKADTDGSLEALRYSVEGLSLEFLQKYEESSGVEIEDPSEFGMKVIRRGVGPIASSDVELAKTFGARIFAFNVRAPNSVVRVAEQGGVEIVTQSVIYHLLDDMRKIMSEELTEKDNVQVLGSAKVLKIFKMNPRNRREGEWIVAGCSVESGEVAKSSRMRVRRGDEIIHRGGLDSLRHFKDDVGKVKQGQECGITLSAFQEFEEGDIIEAYIET
ncbi:Translation initiation factor IF-2 [Hondaea fermentalgiana]|uniref:Translation initiation factor IF-2, mitochondrial n=1 Tax=Hondaea fermentalgiana TaxID=2315210 RepID=A0A2R5G8W8_9STRA|nr:Translation initiation factor IF-2 [Hondaea fermentalgiana]|eukprot:GBG27487.1 Translation initiation factor IF-2 [Hondaea fermentalgiana]